MTVMDEWKEICEEFCKKHNTKLLYVRDDLFGFETAYGMIHEIYADELVSFDAELCKGWNGLNDMKNIKRLKAERASVQTELNEVAFRFMDLFNSMFNKYERSGRMDKENLRKTNDLLNTITNLNAEVIMYDKRIEEELVEGGE